MNLFNNDFILFQKRVPLLYCTELFLNVWEWHLKLEQLTLMSLFYKA